MKKTQKQFEQFLEKKNVIVSITFARSIGVKRASTEIEENESKNTVAKFA